MNRTARRTFNRPARVSAFRSAPLFFKISSILIVLFIATVFVFVAYSYFTGGFNYSYSVSYNNGGYSYEESYNLK